MPSQVRHIPEQQVPNRRLGRHIEHDPRSRAYAFQSSVKGYATIEHKLNLAVLDQLNLGACTGFAAQACCAAAPFYSVIPTNVPARPSLNVSDAQKQAITLYSAATKLDTFYGSYLPTDTGSTGLAVAKAAKEAGLISGYLHTFTLDDALTALSLTPVIVGLNWYTGFDHVAADGLVKVSGSVRGGHEFLLYGLDATKKLVKARNSWGTKWGANGNFCFSFDDFGRLLGEQGDCTVFVPLSNASPVPAPTTPTPDQVLAAAFDVWKKAKGL